MTRGMKTTLEQGSNSLVINPKYIGSTRVTLWYQYHMTSANENVTSDLSSLSQGSFVFCYILT